MPVTGIESILCMNPLNFEPLLLCSSPVIIDGRDFATYYKGKDILYNLWGGEYLALVIEWNRILGDLQKCSIDPLFIFSSDSERRGLQLEYQMKGTQRRLAILRNLQRKEVNDTILEIDPLLLLETLVDILDAVKVRHICSAFSSQRSCASLAHFMQCPVLATSSEYMLLCTELPHLSYSGFSFIPLQCVNPKPLELIVDKQKLTAPKSNIVPRFALSAHKFCAKSAGLTSVSSHLRPFLFHLLGTDALPRIRLPSHVLKVMNCAQASDYKTRRWNALLLWLRDFPPKSLSPIEQIHQCYSNEDRESMLRCLTDCLETYIPQKSIAERLSSFLSESFVSKSKQTIDTSARLNTDSKVELNSVLCGTKETVKSQLMDFTRHWPDELVKWFTQSKLAKFIVTALYTTDGVIMPQVLEDISLTGSIWDASLPLRILQYRYLLGIDHKIRNLRNLAGTKSVVEYISVGDQQMRRLINISPCCVDRKLDTTDEILANFLGIPFQRHTCPLLSLVLSLILWYRWEAMFRSLLTPFDRSPLILSILLIVVANQSNFQALDEMLLEHYEKITCYVESKIGFTAPPAGSVKAKLADLYCVHFVHHFNSIQATYSCLRSSVGLLDQLLPRTQRSQLLEFPPAWKLFPSGRLLHGLAVCLENCEPTSRRHVATRVWLPRLLRLSPNLTIANDTISWASSFFESLLSISNELLAEQSEVFKPEFSDEVVGTINLDRMTFPNRIPTPTPDLDERQPAFKQVSANPTEINNDVIRKEQIARLKHNNISLPSNRGKFKPAFSKYSYAVRLKERYGIDSEL